MRPQRKRPELRLIFDEQLPARVARALRELGFNVSHVGHDRDRAPSLGSSDEVILDHAAKTNQIVVTTDHGMIILAAERSVSVLWIDPRGRQFTLDRLALLCFQWIADWEREFDQATGPVCVRALRTKAEAMDLADAARLAQRRLRTLARRKNTKRPKPLGPLYSD